MRRQAHDVRCSLCNDCGFATVWHQQCIDAFLEKGSLELRDHRSCVVACSCRAGERFREGRQTFTPSVHCPFQTLAKDRALMFPVWCDEHRGPTTTEFNGVVMQEFHR